MSIGKNRIRLTPMQELFCQHFALSANGTQAALKAGTRTAQSAPVMASRWLKKVQVRRRIAQIRERRFANLGESVFTQIVCTMATGLQRGRRSEARKATRILKRLEIFNDAKRLKDYVESLEERCGQSIEDIVAIAASAEARVEWEWLVKTQPSEQTI
jgi:hypothetical protein